MPGTLQRVPVSRGAGVGSGCCSTSELAPPSAEPPRWPQVGNPVGTQLRPMVAATPLPRTRPPPTQAALALRGASPVPHSRNVTPMPRASAELPWRPPTWHPNQTRAPVPPTRVEPTAPTRLSADHPDPCPSTAQRAPGAWDPLTRPPRAPGSAHRCAPGTPAVAGAGRGAAPASAAASSAQDALPPPAADTHGPAHATGTASSCRRRAPPEAPPRPGSTRERD